MIAQIRATCYLDHIWLSLVPAQNVLTRSISFSQRPCWVQEIALRAYGSSSLLWLTGQSGFPVNLMIFQSHLPKRCWFDSRLVRLRKSLRFGKQLGAWQFRIQERGSKRALIRCSIMVGNTIILCIPTQNWTELNRPPAFLMESWTLGTS